MSKAGQTSFPDASAPHWYLHDLGGAGLVGGAGPDAPLLYGPGKPLALILYLSQLPGRAGSRDHIVDLLWSDVDAESGRHTLRQTAHAINKRLGATCVVLAAGMVRLCCDIPSDHAAFLAAADDGRTDEALDCYAGEFLPGFAIPGAAGFEEWADTERRRLHLAFMRLAGAGVRERLGAGRFREAQKLARRMRDADPLDERGWRLLLEALQAAGDTVNAVAEADDLRRMLAREEREAEPATRAMLDLVQRAPATPEASARRAIVADLIGREREFAMVLHAWDAARRKPGAHVHVSGVAGVGKTRLLLDVQARLRAGAARVVAVRANAGEQGMPFALAAALASQLCRLPGAAGVSPGTAALLVGLEPSLSSAYSSPPDVKGSPDELARRRAAALAETLSAVADDAPVALVIDDLHWADASSRHAVVALVAAAPATRALVVTAARPGLDFPGDDRVHTILRLAPLSAPAVAELVANVGSVPDAAWAPGFADALHQATGGSPLLVMDMLQGLLDEEVLALVDGAWHCPHPLVLRQRLHAGTAISRRVAQLTRHGRWLLLLLATAGRPRSTAFLAAAAQRPEDDVRADLEQLEHRALVHRGGDWWETAHDEIATGVLESAAEVARQAAHTALARALSWETAELDDLVRAGQHLVQAGGGDDALVLLLARAIRLARAHDLHLAPLEVARRMTSEWSDAPRAAGLVRRLPRRLASDRIVSLPVAAAVALVALVSAVGGAMFNHAPPPPPDGVLLVSWQSADGQVETRTVPLERDRFPETPVIDAARGAPWRGPVFTGAWDEVTGSADGTTWIAGRPVGDSGAGNDLFLVAGPRDSVRLTSVRGDDLHPRWSPDGRHVAFTTTRWNARGWTDLAVLDLASGAVRRLTAGPGRDASAAWSPDGTRIAFSREGDAGAAVCVIEQDGSGEICNGSGGRGPAVLGWRGPSRVLVQVNDNGSQLLELNLAAGTRRQIAAESLGVWWLSPHSHWAVCACTRADEQGVTWTVFPVDNPDRSSVIGVPAGSRIIVARVITDAKGAGPVDRIAVSAPAARVQAGTSFLLRAAGFDSTGLQIGLRHLAWWSSDTSIATVEATTGRVRARRAGQAMVRVSASGWRSAWARVDVDSSPATIVMREDWRAGLAPNWVAFGTPMPVVDTVAGTPGLNNNGDGTFESGVYTRRTFDASRGVGMEARISAPLTADQYQTIQLWLDGYLDATILAGWDHRGTEYVPRRVGRGGACSTLFPAAEGPAGKRILRSDAGEARLPASYATGRWFTVRLQLFPDGSCGLAVDGRAVGRLPRDASTRWPYRVLLQGASVGTKVLVGPVEVWEGVRTDVDWSVLDR